jgi:hypothetical protein
MANLVVYDYARAYQEDLAREAHQERMAHRARSPNDGAALVDQPAGIDMRATCAREESTMNLSELAACVALIEEDAERRFGASDAATMGPVYLREAVLDLWMAQPDLTAGVARRVLRQVRAALGWHDGDRVTVGG